MHLSSPSFPLILSIFLLTTIVRPHPQLQLPSSGEPPAAFPLENSGITAREDTTTDFPLEDVEIGSPQPLQAFGLNGGPPTAVEQFLSSTSSGSTDHGDGGEMSINDPGLFPSADESSARSGDGNIISQSNACNQNTLKSRRRLRNRHPGQEVPSWCSTNPNQIKSPSEQPTVPGQQQGVGTSNRELNEGSKIPVDVPTADSPTEESGYTGTTETRANLEVCPSDRFYPLCADDTAISAAPAEFGVFMGYTTYMLDPAYACTSLPLTPLLLPQPLNPL